MKRIGWLLACAGLILLVESDIGSLMDLRALGPVDYIFLAIYSAAFYGLVCGCRYLWRKRGSRG